ncbi:MAG: helicase RepA family protein [Rhodocyclales bacterium]|nr:helicase RepA family protein [Thiomonas sp.]MCE1183749.1 helicase RepA family protein [Rhodocyclales bacterium]
MIAAFKSLTLGRAVSTLWPKPEYILGPLQAGDVGQIAGADGLGKSWVALAAALAVSKGRRDVAGGLWDVPPIKGKALYIAVEDRERDHGSRLQKLVNSCAAAGEMSQVREDDDDLTIWALQGQRWPLVQPAQGRTALQPYEVTADAEEFARAVTDYRLVIIDPLRAFHSLQEGDGAGLDFLIRWLVSVAMTNQQALLVVHHASQGAILDKREDHHAGRGATDFVAGCRGVWTLRAASETEVEDEAERRNWRVLSNGKASHGAEAAKRLVRREEGGVMRCAEPAATALEKKKAGPAGAGRGMNKYLLAKNGQSPALEGEEHDDWE